VSQRGFSILELCFVLVLTTVLSGLVAYNFLAEKDKPQFDANHLVALFKRARARALATTQAYTIRPTSVSAIEVIPSSSCDTVDNTTTEVLSLELSGENQLQDITWSICFSPRGIGNGSASIPISNGSETKTVEIFVGGAARIV
jgi:Tfp pilus assembly protein FimT